MRKAKRRHVLLAPTRQRFLGVGYYVNRKTQLADGRIGTIATFSYVYGGAR